MKAFLSFKLPEEREEFELASNAYKFKQWTDEFDEWLRRLIKYENDECLNHDDEQWLRVQAVRDKLHEIRKDIFE